MQKRHSNFNTVKRLSSGAALKRRVSQDMGYGVWRKTRGLVENTRSGGIRRVWWKTRHLVENLGSNWKHGEPFFFDRI